MILYTLRCPKDHHFDAWFRDSAAFAEQVAARHVSCPSCGSKKVEKAIMAPRLGKGESEPAKPVEAVAPDPKSAKLRDALREVRRQVEANCDYVGSDFAEEARRIHYGESDPRGIYGETSDEEAAALNDEGVQVARIPWLPREDA